MKKNWMICCFIAALLLFVSFPVAAIEVDTSGMTNAQKAELVLKAEELKKQAVDEAKKVAETATIEVDDASKWVDLGKNIATVITTVAGDLGIAADKFLGSTSGKITLFIVFWKVAGKDMLGFIIGCPLLIVLVSLWVWSFRRMCIIRSITEKKPTEGFRSIREFEFYGSDDESTNITRVFMAIVLVIIIWICCVIIF